MIDRRTLLLALGAALVAPSMARAQAPARTARVGYISSLQSDAPLPESWRKAFVDRLRELGWIENKNLIIERRYAELRKETARAVVAELIRVPVDVLVVSSTLTALAAKEVTSTVPIVVTVPGDPVATGLVTSLARPGGNVTGVTALGQVLNTKRLELIKEAVPGVTRVGVLINPASTYTPPFLRERDGAARALGLQLRLLEAHDPSDFEKAFATMATERVGALMVQTNAMSITHRKRIVDLVAKNRLPAVYGEREFVDAGGLMFYGASLADMYRDAAVYADKILKGAKPADLPVEQPTKLELIINLKTAKALGLTIPPSVLTRADHVVEK